MNTIKHTIIIILFTLSNQLAGQAFDIELARQYFKEAKTLAEVDAGQLWGIEIYGPLVFVDEETRFGVANHQVPVDNWTQGGDIWYGIMPEKIGFANTSFNWQGMGWSMVIFDHLDTDKKDRASLMMHELFHQFQSQIGLSPEYKKANHLNEKDARVWIQLEWNALLKACNNSGKKRNNGIMDALSFREYRFEMYPEARTNECGKEIQEGTAEYTGMTMCGYSRNEKLAKMQEKIDSLTQTMVWTFTYIAGPLYGFLLDDVQPGWTLKVDSKTEMASLLAEAMNIQSKQTTEDELIALADKYGYDRIIEKENKRADQMKEVMESYQAAFSDMPVLFLPNKQMSIQFDPRRIYPLKETGTLYQVISAGAAWGKLKVTDYGAVLLDGWKGLLLPVGSGWSPEGHLNSENWTLSLDTSYHIIKDGLNWKVEIKPEVAKRIKNETEDLINSFLSSTSLICPVDTSFSINFEHGARKKLNDRYVIINAPLEVSDLWGALVLSSGKILMDTQDLKLYLKNPGKGTDQEIAGDDWRIRLNHSWKIESKNECFQLVQ